MNFRGVSLVCIMMFCVTATMAPPSTRKNSVGNGDRSVSRSKNAKSDLSDCKPKPAQKTCHSEAVLKCGKEFKKKLVNLEKKAVEGITPYKEKCQLRENFLNCVSVRRQKKCKIRDRNKPKYKEELKKIADHLWSTRGCLLGIDY